MDKKDEFGGKNTILINEESPNANSNNMNSNININPDGKDIPEAMANNQQKEMANIENKADSYDTLDEAVIETLKRDMYMIYNKLQVVLWPKTQSDKSKNLRSCKCLL